MVRFFAELLVHTAGPFVRQRFVLRPWQEHDIIRPLFGEVVWSVEWGRYVRRYSVAYIVIARKNGKSSLLAGIVLYLLVGDDEESAQVYGAAKDTKQAGKVFEPALRMMQLSPVLRKRLTHNKNARRLIDEQASPLALDTLVPTPTGWTTIGQINPGDQVYGRNGEPCTVWGISPIYTQRPCYRVGFFSGEQIVASADHLWEVDQRHGDRRGAVLTTTDLAERLRAAGETTYNNRVRLASPVQGQHRDLPLDPYMFGYWLGDGSSYRPQFAVGDQDLAHFLGEVEALGLSYSICKNNSGCNVVYVRGIGYALPYQNKHIPHDYMWASIEQRRALLQGLLDSDGAIHKTSGQVTWVQHHREKLGRQVYQLAASLGYRPVMGSYGKLRQVRFTPDAEPVFRLPRKVGRQSGRARRGMSYRAVVSVLPVESVPVRCISVDSPDNLFLVSEGFIPTHNSYYEIITADALGELGHNPHGFVLDEVLSQPDASLWNALRTAAGARTQPLMLCITTETDRAQSFGADLIDEAERIQADPRRAPHMFAYVRKTPREADPWDEATWPLANPALGDFLSLAAFREEALEAKNDPTKENAFRQFRLNQRVAQASRWMPMHLYGASAGEIWANPDWRRRELSGMVAWCGFDLAAKFDLTAWCLLFPPSEPDGPVDLMWRFWLPEAALPDLDKHNNGRLTTWAAEGWLTVTDGDVLDYDRVYADIGVDADAFHIRGGDGDQWSSYPVIQEIAARTSLVADESLVVYKSTYERMSPGMTELMALVKQERLHHHGNPVASWCFDNIEVRRAPYDPELIRPDKPDRGKVGKRIDAVPAASMAVSAWKFRGEQKPVSAAPLAAWA